jgi:hypothetical protein
MVLSVDMYNERVQKDQEKVDESWKKTEPK